MKQTFRLECNLKVKFIFSNSLRAANESYSTSDELVKKPSELWADVSILKKKILKVIKRKVDEQKKK